MPELLANLMGLSGPILLAGKLRHMFHVSWGGAQAVLVGGW